MKLNIFNVKEKKNDRIIIEEEVTKNPLLLFFRRHKKFITFLLVTFIICLFLIILGVSISFLVGSNDYDITYIVGDEEIGTNTDPDIDDDDIKDDLLGEIAREEGVVLLVRTVMSDSGDVISYYTDKSAIVVKANGKIYRISSNDKGDYGINSNGKIDDTATMILVTSTTTTLSDGVIVTNYSDGTARVELNGNALFVRDSNNIDIRDGNMFNKTNPSGVALPKDISRVNNYYVNGFTDKTTFITVGDKKYVVNKNVVPSVSGDNVSIDWNNAFESISERTYGDYTINHYINGSATVTDKNGNIFFVRKSGDLVLKNKELYEIIPNEKGNSIKNVRCSDGDNVIYYDNGVSIVVNPDGSRHYVEDADEIIYDGNKNISSSYNYSELVSERITEDGEKAYNFDNGKSQVIKSDGSSYIVDTETLKFRPIVDEEVPEEPEEEPGTPPELVDPGEGIFISEAENIYNDFKNIENTTFIIKNNNTKAKTLRIAIEEVSDYRKYNTSRLEPKFVKFQATVGDAYVPATVLNSNVFVDSDGVTNYVIYDGVIGAKSTVNVALSLYVDYSLLNNSHQNKGFIGTIKIYVDA